MPDLQTLMLFLAVIFPLTIMPGPDTLFVLTRGATQGRKAGIVSAGGVGLGYLIHTIAAASGLSLILLC